MTIALGPFELLEPVGRGGMAEVWSGYHRVEGVPVAVKVMTGPKALQPQYVTAFRNEVRAVAGLDHPSVVMLFDHGEVDEAAATEETGFEAGSPYLVMELASGGSLEAVPRPLLWHELKAVLLVLLDALAHAHARGVIHRDIKPGNVLLCTEQDARPGIKLTDFGIAHAVGRQSRMGNLEVSMGTPYYMAPEQIEGYWRDYGPWTDLYALGCIAYELATGELPFRSDNLMRLAYKHLRDDPPRFGRRVDAPDGFEGWVFRLLAKAPQDRFRWAADAAWALAQLGDTDASTADEQSIQEVLSSFVSPVVSFRDTLVVSHNVTGRFAATDAEIDPNKPRTGPEPLATTYGDVHSPLDSGSRPGLTASLPELCVRQAPPLPSTWRRPQAPGPSMRLVGTGLGLYGLRTIPMVGRFAERDAVWDALREVKETQRARLMVLDGAAGTGKGRLAEWMAERAHEVGCATVMKATHSKQPGPSNGIARMLDRHFGSVGLFRGDTLERVKARCAQLELHDAYEQNALTEIVKPATDQELRSGARRIRFGSRLERYEVARRFLYREAERRTLLIWVDDAQWGADALGLVEHVLGHQDSEPAPILFLVTSRDEALAEEHDAEERLDRLRRLTDANTCHIGPLNGEDRTALVQELLFLEGDLAAKVEERTGGNPLFAVQLVGDWVQRGVLEVGRDGFVLKAGEQATLPDDLYEVWNIRVERLLENEPPDAAAALELAAVLGSAVDYNEWEAVCAEEGIGLDDKLIDTLYKSRLAIPDNDVWRFAHQILREALARRSKELGTWREHHRACADMLKVEYPPDKRGIAARIGRHLIEAGCPENAMEPLLQGAQELREASEYRAALDLTTLREQCLRTCNFDERDPRWGQGWVLNSWIASNQGRIGEAWDWAKKAEAAARRHGWTEILPTAVLGLGVAARDRGELAMASELLEEAHKLHEELNHRVGMGHCLQGLGVIARLRGDLPYAGGLITRALELHQRVDNEFGVAQCKLRLSEVMIQEGKTNEARSTLEESLEEHERLGELLGVAHCINGLGTVARMTGDLSSARTLYTDADARFVRLGSIAALEPRKNLGLVALAQGSYGEGRQTLEAVAAAYVASGQTTESQAVSALLLAPLAALALWAPWDDRLVDAAQLKTEDGSVTAEVARWCQWGGQLAAEAGQQRRAQRAYDLAVHFFETVGARDLAAEVALAARALA